MTDFISGKAAIAGGKPWQYELKWELIKTLRIMKLAAILLFAAAMHVSAKGVTQDKISLSLKNAPLEKVFGEIEAQSGFVFIYKDETVKDKRISIQVSNVSLSQALDECLKGQSLSYQIVGKSVAIKANKKEDQIGGEPTGTPPLIDVKGKVLNEKGDPVEGVTVKVKGTEKFTMTDKDGEFSLVTVERDAMLLFTHVTMETFQLRVSGQTDLLIKLKTKVSSLGEVTITVNTGYQQVSKERYVGAVSTLDSAAFHRRAGMDIIGRLDGTVTGILFDKKSTSSLVNLQIRGMSTIQGLAQSASADPLIIVDNFPYKQNLNLLNPNDVESLTVLKDAAATSIWGAQAGNGVIVITTKKGKYNQPTKVTASSNVTIQEKPDQYYYPQMAVADFVDGEIDLFNKGAYESNLANTAAWPAISPVVELLAKKRAGKITDAEAEQQLNAFRSADVRRDLNKYVYRPSMLQQHYVRVSGGSNVINYSFSGGYNRSLNSIQHSKPDDQFTLNSNASLRVVKNLEISSGINIVRSVQKSNGLSLPNIYPYAQLADAEGRSLAIPHGKRMAYLDTAGGGNLLDWKFYPLDELKSNNTDNTSRLIALNFGLSYKFTNWLDARLSYNYTDETVSGRMYSSLKTFYTRDIINQLTNLSETNPNLRNPVPIGGILDLLNYQNVSQNLRAQLNASKTIANSHGITAMVVAERSETRRTGDGSRFYGYNNEVGSYKSTIDYITPFLIYGGQAGTQLVPNGNITRPAANKRFVSFLGNISYSYKQLFTVYGSARKDGSNAFGVNMNKKWKPLWSTGASVDLLKTNLLGIAKNVNVLRFRTSYGISGNPGNGTGLPTISYKTFPTTLTNIANWAEPNDPPNADLGWEKVATFNNGIDFSLFNNRLSGSIDIYQKRSTDIISMSPVQPSTGVNSVITNNASLKGNGFEIRLNSKNIVGPFSWQTNIGISHATTRVTKLFRNFAPTAKDFVNYGMHAVEGEMAFGIASYKWAGLDPLTGDPRGYLNKSVSNDYQAIFNDSVRNQSFNGSAIPLYFGNITNTFSWRNFTLTALVTYRLNFYFRKPTVNYYNLVNSWRGHADYASRWQKPGDENFTTVPSFTYPLNGDRDIFYQYSNVNILRGDNIRLQDVRLDYVWNIRAGRKARIDMTTFMYANNLNVILWRKNKSNLDPDFVGGDDFSPPTPIAWTVGLNLNL